MKSIENYLEQLETGNGYCECFEVRGLYLLRRKAEKLRDFDGFKTAKNKYYGNLSNLVNSRKLKLLKHNLENELTEELNPNDIENDMVVTIHCPTCEQQIDIVNN